MSELSLSAVDKVSTINSKDFVESYFKPLKPLVIKDVAKAWPALTKWTPEFFKEQHGKKQVKVYDGSFVEAGDNYMSGVKTMNLSDYIEQVLNTPQDLRMFLYNIKSEIPEIINDIVFPDIVNGFSKKFVFMFFGCKDSVTQMHFDIDMSHVFHTALYGKKTITLFSYEQSKNLHRYPFTCRSYVDIDNPDYERFPGLKKAKGYQVVLEKGETLFIPSGYWHHVVYDEPGYAVSLRCANSTLMGKLHGAYNLLVMQMVDRIMNKLSSDTWFKWKESRASQI
jgi:cupin-like protein